MKITRKQLRSIIREATGGIPAGHMADALVAHLRNPDTDLMSTDEVVEWLSREFNLEAAEDLDDYQSDDKLIDNVLNDTRLDDLYEPRDDAWGVSEVPYAGPGDGSLMRGLTNFAESRVQEITKRQLRRIIKEEKAKLLREGGGIAMSPEELVAHGESVWTPDMEGYHPLIDGEATSNGITKQALHGGWAVEEYQAEIEDLMVNNLDNPHVALAYDIVFNDAAPGYLPFNFFNSLSDEFEKLGASKKLMGHLFHVRMSDDFEMNPPGW